MPATDPTLTGFHVSRGARDQYNFAQDLFSYIGKAQISNFQAARQFAEQMNARRDIANDPAQIVQPSAINAVALIQGIQQYLFRAYCARRPGLLSGALQRVTAQLGDAADKTINTFIEVFPPQPVYQGAQRPYDFIEAMLDGRPARELTVEELLMLWLSNANPAFRPFFEIFGDTTLRQKTAYPQLTSELNAYFAQVAATDPGDGQFPANENILDLLLAPVRAAPDSLEAQLKMLLDTWGEVLDESFIMRMLTVIDTLREDYRFLFTGGPVGTVPGASMAIPTFGDLAGSGHDPEFEAFTADREWMPNLVLMAKNAYVWLDQLSKKYGEPLLRLDQIPDAELDQIGAWGFTGLWLIGLWERSEASKRIKHISGNPDAVASAYSLWDYQIAQRLGGEEALNNLRARAWKRGIRLASDMVPNHVGVDGRWVVEHPEYFISLDYSPYPNYTFNGPDLSADPRVSIFIEDHYYDRSDAAVVFKRVDNQTGKVTYVYHGNDGTTMPWNDTAQLNYLSADLREAMVRMIIDIAKRFPVIRFDAAMTLVKRHVHRLWWPEPGSGSGIASRAQFGMSKAQFDQYMPEEFWREVVDRAAVEAPDTLLLAEAFWMMEGYFVRTLGMHRVYNSAFMNMLRDEENAKYRQLMKNTLEFDPEILRRYVNFLNNPDEKTAVEQFGKGDKYFGISMLMLTLPGLPMFGHGQVEGFTEKYGMEYYRAYYDETPDRWLIERHERELFPIMKKRALFAGVDAFTLYDFETAHGNDENVFAFSNRFGDERTVVAYNNRYGDTAGWVRNSVTFSVKVEGQEERALTTRTLAEGLDITASPNHFVTFRDVRTGLEYIRSAVEVAERGLFIQLAAYQYSIMLDFRILEDHGDGRYRDLAEMLDGRGVPSIYEAIQEMVMEPVLTPFRALVNAETLHALIAHMDAPQAGLLDEVEARVTTLIAAVHNYAGTAASAPSAVAPAPADARLATADDRDDDDPESEAGALGAVVHNIMAAGADASDEDEVRAPSPAQTVCEKLEKTLMLPLQEAQAHFSALSIPTGDEGLAVRAGLIIWALLAAFGEDAAQTRAWVDEWLLGRAIMVAFSALGVGEAHAARALNGIKLATGRDRLLRGSTGERPDELVTALIGDPDARMLLGVNQFNNVVWYDDGGFHALLRWLYLVPQVESTDDVLNAREASLQTLLAAHAVAGYQVNPLRAAIKEIMAAPVAVPGGRTTPATAGAPPSEPKSAAAKPGARK
jgi:glycosidase